VTAPNTMITRRVVDELFQVGTVWSMIWSTMHWGWLCDQPTYKILIHHLGRVDHLKWQA
jgi:hypothetical protein